jgi:hypothetical protein
LAWPNPVPGELCFTFTNPFRGIVEAFAHPADADRWLHTGLILDGQKRRVELAERWGTYPDRVHIRVWAHENPVEFVTTDPAYAWQAA